MEKLKVFVSSTWTDLQPEREAVKRALDRLSAVSFEGMEYFGSRPETPKKTCLAEVAKSDLYVGIFAHRYGSIDPETDLSMTELEYRKAEELGRPCYVYLKSDEVPVRPDYVEQSEEGRQKLKALRERLKGTHTLSFFVSPDDLALRVIIDLYHHFSRRLARPTPAPQSAMEQFAQWVRDWLAVTNYVIRDFQIRDPRQADVTVELRVKVGARMLVQRILVRCIYGEISVADVQEMQTELAESTELTDGWLISPRRVSQVARDEAAKQESLSVYTFDELIDEHANWDRYFTWLEEEVKRRGIDRYYVDLGCTKDDIHPETKEKLGTSRYERVDDYVGQWLDDPAKEHISILGEFGTGKTWFCLHYAYEAMQAYKVAKEAGRQRPRLPIVIPLRDFVKAMDVETLFSDFFFRKFEIGLPGYSAYEQLNRMGKLLLIFDGFDEMADKTNRQKQIDNFWQLARSVGPGAKAILTCRTEHFEFAKAALTTFRGEETPTTSPEPTVLLEPPRFEVISLEKLSPAQITEIIVRREGEVRGQKLAQHILDTPALADLAHRPGSIEYIIAALPLLPEEGEINLAQVYLYASRELLLKNVREKRSFTSMADKVHFLGELAWEMLSTSELKINFTQFPERLRRYRPELKQRELDHWKYDLEGQTLLVRDDEGDYAFSHKAMAEFFVAYKFAAELGLFRLDSEWITSYFPAESVPEERPARQWHEFLTCPDATGTCNQRVIEKDGSVRCRSMAGTCIRTFAAEPLGRVAATFGRLVITPEVLDFLAAMVEETTQLWDLIGATAGKAFEQVGYVGGNAASLLRQKGESFKDAKLARTVLIGADLRNVDLTGVDLRGTCLREANLSGCIMDNADLREADLVNVRVKEMGAVHALAWSPDGQWLASGREDGKMQIWDSTTWNEAVALADPEGAVRSLCWSPSGSLLASGNEEGLVMLWNSRDWKESNRFRVSSSAVTYLHFKVSEDQYIAAAASDGTLGVYDCTTGTPVLDLGRLSGGANAIRFSPDEQYIAGGGGKGMVAIWGATSGELKAQLVGSEAPVTEIHFCPSTNHLIAFKGSYRVEVWSHLGVKLGETDTDVVWERYYEQYTSLLQNTLNQAAERYYEEHQAEFEEEFALELSGEPDELRLKQLKQDFLSLYNPDYYNMLVGAIREEIQRLLNDEVDHHEVTWEAIEELRKGLWLKIHYVGFVECWDIRNNGRKLLRWGPEYRGRCLIALPEDSYGIGNSNGCITIWESQFDSPCAVLRGHRGSVNSLSLNPKHKWLASGSEDATVRIWDADRSVPNSWQCLKVLEGRMNCHKMRIDGTKGLDVPAPGGEGTLRDWLRQRGAVE